MAADLKALRQKDVDYQKLLEQIVRQDEELHKLVSENNRLNQLVVKLSEQLALHQKYRFAGRSQKNRKSGTSRHEETTSDRQQDKDDFDVSSSSISNDDVTIDTEDADKEEKHTTGVDEFRKGSKYNTMAAGEVHVHESDETQIPEGCTFLFKHIRRSSTIERNNAPTFCSHKGVEVSALYHTVIETCKLQGYSVLEYLEVFFTAVIKGRTDYENLMPATIGISKMK